MFVLLQMCVPVMSRCVEEAQELASRQYANQQAATMKLTMAMNAEPNNTEAEAESRVLPD